MRKLLTIAAVLTLAVPAYADHHGAAPSAREVAAARAAALNDSHRTAADRARDAWRHPAQTLAFFRVEPGMTVVDYMPSSGWWTRVLVPYLGTGGRYIGVNPDVSAQPDRIGAADYLASIPRG